MNVILATEFGSIWAWEEGGEKMKAQRTSDFRSVMADISR